MSIYLYIIKKKTPNQLKALLDSYRKETIHYNSKEIIKEFDFFEKNLTEGKMNDIKKYVESTLEENKLLK